MTDTTEELGLPSCASCCHWEQDEHDWTAAGAGFGQCMAIRERWVIADEASQGMEWNCSEEDGGYMDVRRKALQEARAYVQDGSEYRAELLTGPDFHCALFTARTALGGEHG